MGRAATLRARQGFYAPHDGSQRIKPDTNPPGTFPKTPGPHGKTLKQPRHVEQAQFSSYLHSILSSPRKMGKTARGEDELELNRRKKVYNSWTVNELTERATRLEIRGRSKMKKAELIDAIVANEDPTTSGLKGTL